MVTERWRSTSFSRVQHGCRECRKTETLIFLPGRRVATATVEMAEVVEKIEDEGEGEVEAEVVVIARLDKKTANPTKTRAH